MTRTTSLSLSPQSKMASCLLALISIVLPASAELSEVETKYLVMLANYTGGMGVGFVPWRTYDYNFRQAVLKSKDEGIQRAFILQKLPMRIDDILYDLKKNQTTIGKTEHRDLTPEERTKLIQSFEECMKLLQELDANKYEHFYQAYRDAFDAIQTKRRSQDAGKEGRKIRTNGDGGSRGSKDR